MGLFQVSKPKSAAKEMVPSGQKLRDLVGETLHAVSEMVGVTLGPGGRQVLIERGEMNMRPIVTKDGVTVIRNLGFSDSLQQLVLEAVRDSAIKTASEAGDGTTTATILSDAIASSMSEALKGQAHLSPQRVVREMESLVPWIEERIDGFTVRVDGGNYQEILKKVATLSANGDKALADAVVEAFDQVGDEGNMTIVEVESGSGYKVERIDGYAIDVGYEETCKNLSPLFINDPTGTMVTAANPVFLLFDGVVTDLQQIVEPLNKLSDHFEAAGRHDRCVVLITHGFSDSVVGDLQLNWSHPKSTIRVFPMRTPQSAIRTSGRDFLYDLQAYTGSPVFNPITKPFSGIDPESLVKSSRGKMFECTRFRTSVMVHEDEFAIQVRVDELKAQRQKPESDYELRELNVRIGKLTSGIARLSICGRSAGETREKRDRADDAWCAIRGAVKHGTVPGGGYCLVKLSDSLYQLSEETEDQVTSMAASILKEAFLEPVRRLYQNYGFNAVDVENQICELSAATDTTYDILQEKWVDKTDLLDSKPAVVEAIRNSLSIASLLGTLGGVVAFKRDKQADRDEQQFARRFESSIGENQ